MGVDWASQSRHVKRVTIVRIAHVPVSAASLAAFAMLLGQPHVLDDPLTYVFGMCMGMRVILAERRATEEIGC